MKVLSELVTFSGRTMPSTCLTFSLKLKRDFVQVARRLFPPSSLEDTSCCLMTFWSAIADSGATAAHHVALHVAMECGNVQAPCSLLQLFSVAPCCQHHVALGSRESLVPIPTPHGALGSCTITHTQTYWMAVGTPKHVSGSRSFHTQRVRRNHQSL